MKTLQQINFVVSFIIMVSSLYLLFRHYSDEKSKLEKDLKLWQYLFLKIGLVFMAMGTFFNLIKKESTPASEILLNVGLALFMIFLAMLFDSLFLTKKPKQSKNRGVDPAGEEFPDDQEE